MRGIELKVLPDLHVVYHGRSLLVTNRDGWLVGEAYQGLYFDSMRFLSREEVTFNGEPPVPVGVSPVDGRDFLGYYMISRDGEAHTRSVFLTVRRFLDEGLRTRYHLQNYSLTQVFTFDVVFRLEADFADFSEAERGQRQQSADVSTTWVEGAHELRFTYHHPELRRAVNLRLHDLPVPARFDDNALHVQLELEPRQLLTFELTVEPVTDDERRRVERRRFGPGGTVLDHARERILEEAPRLTTPNSTVARAWQTALHDLASLPLGMREGPTTPAAGLPMFHFLFGRDALTAAWQALLATKTMMRDTLRVNTALQGTKIDDFYDEEPGKMINRARRGPLSLLKIDPFLRYYGDYATPPDFLIMLGQYLAWTNDLETVRSMLPAARETIAWLERYGDLDGDGFIEYTYRTPVVAVQESIKNQGWKDSPTAVVNEYGRQVEPPIAPCEIQAYWYVGLKQVALAFMLAGDRAYALELLGKARALKRRFNARFWLEDEGFYAFGLGPDKQLVRSIASNTGHLLATGIVPPERAQRVIARLMQPDMFSGWGIRTLSSNNPAFNPFSYHLGSVWPVENGTFALGFARYGAWEALHRLTEGLFASTELFVSSRLPEVLGGLPRDEAHPHPGIYPNSNAPQAWSASMIVLMTQALLGIQPMAPFGLLMLDPHLPPWLPHVQLEGIRVGQTLVDLEVWRTPRGETMYRAKTSGSRLLVLRQPAPEAPGSSITGRIRTAFRSLL